MESRIWIDGCFDFFHHGHAGVMLQARQQGEELYVGVHSDEDILEHKGPPVMFMAERVSAAEACRWVTKAVPDAPYVTQLDYIDKFDCKYVVHGDDITSDSGGEDCYRFVKRAGRFKVVKRTEGISTTDLVGRMLLMHKSHFIKSLSQELSPADDANEDAKTKARYMQGMIHKYAADATGAKSGVNVYFANASQHFDPLIRATKPKAGQRVVYVDGGFDLFSSGHIEFLRQVKKIENEKAASEGWNAPDAAKQRIAQTGGDYDRGFVVVGMHDDEVINEHKGQNYPIMNIFERGLCVLQCKYIDAVVFGAPFAASEPFLKAIPEGMPSVVYHGCTSFVPLDFDPYADAKRLGIFAQVPEHPFQNVNAANIVQRILDNRERFEARQKAKAGKSIGEEEARRREAAGGQA